MPVHLPFTIDLILVPCLLVCSYFVVVLIASIIRGVPAGHELVHRLGAVLTGAFLLLLCLTIGGLFSYGAQLCLPPRILKSMASLGINADLNTGFGPVHLRGDVISLLALFAGLGFCLNRIRKSPETKRTVQLTREQRMTPYHRMLQERQQQVSPTPQRPRPGTAEKKVAERPRPQPRPRSTPQALCNNQPLSSLQPEAVNYRPM
jgi:hypothetical protein